MKAGQSALESGIASSAADYAVGSTCITNSYTTTVPVEEGVSENGRRG